MYDVVRELETVYIPQWALVALTNGDYTGIDDHEEEILETWLQSKYVQHDTNEIVVQAVSGDHPELRRGNDIHDVLDECTEVRLFAQKGGKPCPVK